MGFVYTIVRIDDSTEAKAEIKEEEKIMISRSVKSLRSHRFRLSAFVMRRGRLS